MVADEADGSVLGGVDAGEGRDELVGDAVVVEILDSLDGAVVGSAFGVAGDHGVEGLFFLFPAEVAVHGVVAAADGGEVADTVLANLRWSSCEVAEAAGGYGVAAVHEGVDVDVGEFLLFRRVAGGRRGGAGGSGLRRRRGGR